jgi:hypothetical protein
MNTINSYTSWQPLEEVVVGRAYTPDYFDFISDHQVRNQLQLILEETNQDLDNLQKTIAQYGTRVLRPDLPEKQRFLNQQIKGNGAPLPPLTPRDWQITLGDTLLRILPIREMDRICYGLGANVVNPHGSRFNNNCVLNGASASCIIRVGRDIFFDNSEFLTEAQSSWIKENILNDQDYRFHEARTEGHGDAVFAILKPGVILSTYHADDLDLESEFPGWDFLKLNDPSIKAALDIGKFKEENFNGAWYVQDQTPTPAFRNYVDQYLNHWVGHVSETVFDVNCLVLDEQNVIFSAYNKQVFDFCEKHGINPIICELRHSYFWDGGISCCTQDIRRRGGLETYL